ncbi:hypothetical protein [Staphylococcus sp. GDX8P80P]|nr:hypothetical protein [Staphylococcus sp. GDX8P80P]
MILIMLPSKLDGKVSAKELSESFKELAKELEAKTKNQKSKE